MSCFSAVACLLEHFVYYSVLMHSHLLCGAIASTVSFTYQVMCGCCFTAKCAITGVFSFFNGLGMITVFFFLS